MAFYARDFQPERLSFTDIPGSMKHLSTLEGLPMAARCAVNVALWDGAAKRAGRPLHDFIGLGFRENKHLTSLSIGIDSPELVRKKCSRPRPYRCSNSKSATEMITKILRRCAPLRRTSRSGWTPVKVGVTSRRRCANWSG